MLKSIQSVDLSDKRVLLRVDFNVPIENGKVQDLNRIKSALPTIKYLLKKNCRIVLVSHLGRPDGRVVKSLSLKPVFVALKKMLPSVKMRFVEGKINEQLVEKVRGMNDQIIFLENLRFDSREEKNDERFSTLLAKLGRVYVNEAFSVCHRESASVVGVTKSLPEFAGLNLKREVEFLGKALNPKKPAIAIIGGAKLDTKIGVIKNFLKIYDYVLIGGAAANTFFAALGYDVGASLIDKKMLTEVKTLLKSKKVLLPKDMIICNNGESGKGERGEKSGKGGRIAAIGQNKDLCEANESIVDIGPATIVFYSEQIKKARTIVWCGPMGLLEDKKFRKGSVDLAKVIGKSKAIKIAGGGETEYAIQLAKQRKKFSFISTGGGAMLELLEGKELPGLINL